MKFLLYEIILRAGFNLATDWFWPTGHMFDIPGRDTAFGHGHVTSTIRKEARV